MRIRAAQPSDPAQLEASSSGGTSSGSRGLARSSVRSTTRCWWPSATGGCAYVVRGGECEVLTLHSDERRKGVGSRLIAEVTRVARRAGCNRLWLITTNDNVDAMRFYQRRDFRLAALHTGAVDASRIRLKPEIPEAGDHGIPIRDELELELEQEIDGTS